MNTEEQSEKVAFQAPRTLLRAKDAAARLSIGLSTWKDWVARGLVEPGVLVGKRMKVWDSVYVEQVMNRILDGTFGKGASV